MFGLAGLFAGAWWLKPAIGVIVVAAAAVFVLSYGHGRYKAGESDATTRMQRLMDKQTAAANEAVAAANAHTAAVEQLSTQKIAQVDAQYQKELSDETFKRDAVLADLRSGNRRLRVSLAHAPACRGQVPGVATGAGGDPGAATGELSGSVAANLVEFAHRADNLARQLAACQAVIIEDRRAINGQP